MNLLQRLRAGFGSMIRKPRKDEDLGPCTICGDDVTHVNGGAFEDGAAHTECRATSSREREQVLALDRVYKDAVGKLEEIGDPRISAIALDVGRQIRASASRETLVEAMRRIEERTASDRSIPAAATDAVKCITAHARANLHPGTPAAGGRRS